MATETHLVLPGGLVKQILTHVQRQPSTESCGLISGMGGSPMHYYAIANIADEPSIRFEMDPTQQIAAMKHMREHNQELLAIVHSHPRSPPIPSITDVQEAGYPEAYYLIVSLRTPGVPQMRAFKKTNGEMQAIQLRYADLNE